MAKRRNFAEEAARHLRTQRHWGVQDFDQAWAAMWTKLFRRALPSTTTAEYRVEILQWQRALAFARPAFDAAFHGDACPMIEHFHDLPELLATSPRANALLGVSDDLRDNGSRRVLELVA